MNFLSSAADFLTLPFTHPSLPRFTHQQGETTRARQPELQGFSCWNFVFSRPKQEEAVTVGRLWWLQQHLSSCSPRDAKDSPRSQPRAWLSSLSYLYSQVAARLQDALIKIKFKKKKRGEAGGASQRTGEAC